MALQKTVTTQHGFTAEDAYHRVESLSIKGKGVIEFQCRSYKDSGELPFFSDINHRCTYNIDGKNPFEQAYEHLKSLDEYIGFIDC